MNKVLEQICSTLGERLLFHKNRMEEIGGTERDVEDWGSVKAYSDAIEIVQEVAEEYKGGWIPCSERLPEEYTVLCCDKCGEMIVGHPYFDEISNTNYSTESDNEMMYNCVAWQPLPEPFKEREE